mmetsp:Transcript_94982/g.241425  ORF Transcript_94982/g.241425 Transcript_94982/m.241425 type:complete len:203 (+) Transcript_94982:209-817(+)
MVTDRPCLQKKQHVLKKRHVYIHHARYRILTFNKCHACDSLPSRPPCRPDNSNVARIAAHTPRTLRAPGLNTQHGRGDGTTCRAGTCRRCCRCRHQCSSHTLRRHLGPEVRGPSGARWPSPPPKPPTQTLHPLPLARHFAARGWTAPPASLPQAADSQSPRGHPSPLARPLKRRHRTPPSQSRRVRIHESTSGKCPVCHQTS